MTSDKKPYIRLGANGRLAVRKTWLATRLTLKAIARLYDISPATVKRFVRGLERPANPRAQEPNYGPLRALFQAETGCRSELSWLTAIAMAGETELVRYHAFMEETR